MNNNHEYDKLKKEYDELNAKYEMLLSAVEHLPNPIFMKDEDARFFFFNKAYAEFFDMRRRDYIGKTVLDLEYLDMKDRERFQYEDLKAIMEGNIVSYDTSFTTSDGKEHPSFYWSRGFKDEYSGRLGIVGEIVDISKERVLQESLDETIAQLKKANEKLRTIAETDQASGLYNRLVLWKLGEEIVANFRKMCIPACMVMFDLDNFKMINDEFGHLYGDEILVRFAEILKDECRYTDIPIRYGGDEFLMILRDLTLENSIKVAERIRERVSKEIVLPNGKVVTVSAGIIEIDNKDFEDNLSRLDGFLYKAKKQGRDQIVCA